MTIQTRTLPDSLLAGCAEAMKLGDYDVAVKILAELQTMSDGVAMKEEGLTLHDIYMLKGNCRLKMEDVQGAREEFERALRAYPESAGACFGLGLCFEYAGITDAARQMFEAALALRQGWTEAQSKILVCSSPALHPVL